MSKKIYVSPSNQVGNIYATGNTNEKEQCHKIARACVDALVENGFQVMCTYNDDMYKRVEESNAFGADIHIAIHTNATAKHNVTGGSQVLLYSISGEREKAGNVVLSRLSSLTPGKSAERLVLKPDFYEVRATKGLALYCECEFHDTQLGSDFIINNTDKIGEAIAYGICDYYGIVPKNKNSAPNDGTLFKVQVGAFSIRENAESYLAELKKAGFDGFIVS
jgi:N-acetylmuramoyl-L-alanine amidase